MTDKLERLRVLLLKYSNKASSPAEEAELYALLNSSAEDELEPLLTSILETTDPYYDQQRSERILASVFSFSKREEEDNKQLTMINEQSRVRTIKLWKRVAVAASIVGLLFVGYWFMKDKTTDDRPQTTVLQTHDVQAPDKNRAQITLADGTTVYLDSAANGQLADLNGVVVKKTDDGRIEYNGQLTTGNEQIVYNTLTNPRGSKVIDMTLSDGSRVWLNAGSSVTYPVAFVSSERKVSVTGEAYFEVNGQRSTVNGKKIPFLVEANGTVTEVLGTHFNVNAYDDEHEVKVTLLEGSVRVQPVADSRKSVVIKPGQQAVASVDGGLSTMDRIDVQQVMAWKNGQFSFNGTELSTIMRDVARWYDVTIVYASPVNEKFYGDIPRTSNLLNLIKLLEATGLVRFEINDKTVTVYPK